MPTKRAPRKDTKTEQADVAAANEQPSRPSFTKAVRSAWKTNLSLIPIKADGTKEPKGTWKRNQSERASEATVLGWCEQGVTGIAIVTGAVSQNVEALDFDDRETFEEYVRRADAAGLSEVVARIRKGYEEETPSDGMHWLYRCDEIDGNQKLASRPKLPEERRHPKDNLKVLIETRGEGGYIIVAPSHGGVHPSGHSYVLRNGGFDQIVTITPEERQALFELSQTFDRRPIRPDLKGQEAKRVGSRPGDVFGAATSWREILEPAGWTFVFERDDEQFYRRPGKDRGVSATTNFQGSGLLVVFSTSTDFETGRGYGKFSAFAIFNHHSDFKAAARALWKQGHGSFSGRRPAPPLESQTGGSEPESDPFSEEGGDASENAREIVQSALERLADDPGAVFEVAVIQAIAHVYKTDPPEYARILKDMKTSGADVLELGRRIRAYLAESKKNPAWDRRESLSVGSIFEDAPMPELMLPSGYELNEHGTFAGNGGLGLAVRVVAHAPVILTGRLKDVDDGREHLELAYRRPNGWQRTVVARGSAVNARDVVSLAERGFPVSSLSARDFTKYVSDFETRNYSALPCRYVSSHLGWVSHDQGRGFLWGRTWIGAAGRYSGSEPNQPVMFHGEAVGDEQIAAGYHANGSMQQWRDAVQFLPEHPRAFMTFVASFAPPLLELVQAPNFSVDLSNPTSTGKTTTLRAAASVWGKPDERAADAALTTWDNTRVFIERASAVVSAIPLILDDTKRAKEAQLVADIIYAVSSGRGRGRGALTGLERTRVWRTVLISSGEAPAVSFTQDGGTRTRVLTVRGQPFGRADSETGQMVRQLNLAIQSHYGHAGPRFVEYLLKHRELWKSYAEEYRADCARLANQSSTPEVGRLAELMGVIVLAARLASEALGLDWDWETPINAVWEQIIATAADAPGEIRALQDVMGWAIANQEAFHGREAGTGMYGETARVPTRGWLGAWEHGADWENVAFIPRLLREQLTNAGYHPEAILSGWRDRGWLDVEEDRAHPYTKRVNLSRERVRCVVVKREAVEAADV